MLIAWNESLYEAESNTRTNELSNSAMSPLFQAVAEATEEAIYNSLLQAEDVVGHLGTIRALPVEMFGVRVKTP